MEDLSKFSACTLSFHQCKCFEKLTPEQKEFLDANSVKIKYRKGEIIAKQGGFVSHVIYMEKGLAKVFLENGSNSLVLRITPDRNFVGLSSVSEEHPYFPYSAMTRTRWGTLTAEPITGNDRPEAATRRRTGEYR